MYLLEFTEHTQRAPDKFPRTGALFGRCFAPSKYKILLQDWTRVLLNLLLNDQELTILNCFSYLA